MRGGFPPVLPAGAATFAPATRLALVVLAMLAAPTAARAAGFSLGVGALSGKASSDALVRDARSAGWEVSAGYRAWERVTLEGFASVLGEKLATEETTDIYYPRDEAEVGMAGLGLRVDILPLVERRWTPWIGAGLGLAMLNWETFFYSQGGVAPYLTAGLDVEPVTGLIVRGRVSGLSARTHDNYDHATPRVSITTFSLALAYEFGRRRRLPPRDDGAPISVPPPAPPAVPAPDPATPEPEAR